MPQNIKATNSYVDNSAKVSKRAYIEAANLYIGKDVIIEDGVSLAGEKIYVCDGTRIRRGVNVVSSRKINLESLSLGDFCDVWENCKIYLPKLSIGDYATVQDGVRFQGHLPLSIGHNFWVGSDAILNSSGGLTIGNNVGIGARSEIYSHGYHGELLEGCVVNSIAPVTIGNDVWLTGSVYVSPGVTIGDRAIVLFQSNVTKDVLPNSLARGNPAKVVEVFSSYKNLDIQEKLNLRSNFLGEFGRDLNKYSGYTIDTRQDASSREDVLSTRDYQFKILLTQDPKTVISNIEGSSSDVLLITVANASSVKFGNRVTHFSLTDKLYTKMKTPAEVIFMKYMVPLKARFTPLDRL